MTVVLVVGTGTEVGKTWVSVRLLGHWRGTGRSVAARKPVQSFEPGSGPTDAELLAAASGEDPRAVCPPSHWLAVPMAPPMAAEALGLPPPRLPDLLAGLRWPAPTPEVGLVETVGGVRSPQADDADALDLVRALDPDRLVLVADAGLGTVNAVRLSVDALGGPVPVGGPPVTVVLNRYDPQEDLHRRNRRWLADRLGLDVVPVAPGELAALADRLVAGRRPAPAG